ncbi:hypothetical protein K474DRAFT_1659127 [Panus rudis PR-1116 ss-1]|nr:hypothetical protein K474DRAFT_1659127 [Panus rudis PR-1116 ss-1]
MVFFKHLRKGKENSSSSNAFNSNDAPPEWTPAPEQSHTTGLYSDATNNDFESAEAFCAANPPDAPRLLPSDVVDRIRTEGCRVWDIQWPRSSRFVGNIRRVGEKGGDKNVVTVATKRGCKDVCLFSDLPIMAGLYDIQGKLGVYFEVQIHRMDGVIAIGTACRPYPDWRFPGWNRLSAGLHLDDMRKFYEDPDGGRDYTPELTRLNPGDYIGCGYEFSSTSIFFTHNGRRLPNAFSGAYVPRMDYDVYAAIGVEGACEFDVNFGGGLFKWKEGNEWAWRVEGHVGKLAGGPSGLDDELPSYNEVRGYGGR